MQRLANLLQKCDYPSCDHCDPLARFDHVSPIECAICADYQGDEFHYHWQNRTFTPHVTELKKASEESLLLHSSKTLSLQLSTGCIIRLSVDIMNIAQIVCFAVVAAASAADATMVAAAFAPRHSIVCDGPCTPHKNSSCETGYEPREWNPACWMCCELP
ncbi:hypothetical protein P692DRAFT_20222368 [Suillus brevipes Sb2]|nr:hypothetical protein P692DRAFT_20222368 [Suillus brevipes Sb2]